jgi:hypothetical protein
MMRKVGLTLLCASSLLTTDAFSTTYSTFKVGRPIEYELPVNDPLIISNILFWQIKAVCLIISDPPGTPITVTMLRKTGSVNDTPLATGDSIGLTVQPGDIFNVTADSGAKVQLVNLGSKPIKASCSAV